MPLDTYTQAKRLLRIETPLGPDKLLLEQMDGSEALSSPFAFQLRVRAFHDNIEPAQIVHRPVDWFIRLEHDTWRQFNGLVASYSGGEAITREQRSYTLTVVPWLWFLQHRQDCKVFQNKTVPQIVTEVFDDAGFKDYDLSGLAQQYHPRVYCTQYRESDFNFVSRLLEEEGIFYSFKHVPGRHILMLADGAHAYKDLTDSVLPFNQSGIFKNSVTRWAHNQTFRSGKTATNDYNFEQPGNNLLASTNAATGVPHASNYEIYDYPGRYGARDKGEGISKRLMQAHEKGQDTISAGSRARTLAPAGRFALEAHPIDAENARPFAIVSVNHHGAEGSYDSIDKGAPFYQNTFTCLPAKTDFVPEQRSEKPVIPGMQSALVTGPAGEEIYTDKHGRVKVHFYWDRKGKRDETSSCWLRVAQPWAGGTFGGQTIPRVGMEVLVSFMEGDPDHPLIVGSMPNGDTPAPYGLPENRTRMVMRSNTYKGKGFNELTMEDQTGAERLHLHAQHDHTTKVGNNQTERVDSHQVQSVGGSRSVEVGGNQKHEVGGSMTTTVGGTGLAALAQAAPVAGLAGHTAGLLSQAMGGDAGGIAMNVASSALGFLSGGGLGSRSGVVAGPSPRADAGEALAGAGGGVGTAVAGLFGLSGIMNTVVGAFRNDTVGTASTEQVGVAKVVNVGDTSLEQVGNYKKIAVGQQFVIECGASKFIMEASGKVTILGTQFNFIATGPVQVRGTPIDLN